MFHTSSQRKHLCNKQVSRACISWHPVVFSGTELWIHAYKTDCVESCITAIKSVFWLNIKVQHPNQLVKRNSVLIYHWYFFINPTVPQTAEVAIMQIHKGQYMILLAQWSSRSNPYITSVRRHKSQCKKENEICRKIHNITYKVCSQFHCVLM